MQSLQTYTAWLIVVLAVGGLLYRRTRRRRRPGCDADCGCGVDSFKKHLRQP